jgi:hypothetical protein
MVVSTWNGLLLFFVPDSSFPERICEPLAETGTVSSPIVQVPVASRITVMVACPVPCKSPSVIREPREKVALDILMPPPASAVEMANIAITSTVSMVESFFFMFLLLMVELILKVY